MIVTTGDSRTHHPLPVGHPDWDALNAMWQQLVADLPSDEERPEAIRWARRWAIVHTFGSAEQYEADAEFHARVHLLLSALDRLDSAPRPKPRHTCTPGLIGSAYGCPACGIAPAALESGSPALDGFTPGATETVGPDG